MSYVFALKKPMDSTNLAFMAKLIEDSLVEDGVLLDDSSKFVLATQLIPIQDNKENWVFVHINDEDSLTYSGLLKLANERT